MEHLKLSARPWRVGSNEGVLGPTENGIHANFLRGDNGNGNVFRDVPEIENVRLNRQALAKILGIRLHNPVAAAIAARRVTHRRSKETASRVASMVRWYRMKWAVFAALKPGNQAAAAEPFHQIRETAAIFLTHGG